MKIAIALSALDVRFENPFMVFGIRPKLDKAYRDANGVKRRVPTKSRIAIYRKGGPRRETVPASLKLDASTSRQVRRQLARQHAKFTLMGEA